MKIIERLTARSSRRFFTLLEMLIVMALLVIVAGIGGISLTRLVAIQRFDSETEGLLTRLNRAQEILMLLNIETKATIGSKEFKLVPVGMISDSYEKMLKKERLDLSRISFITFESYGGDESSSPPIELSFLDRGLRLPYGLLTLGSEQGEKRYILFRGYPSPLKLYKNPPNWQEIESKERELKDRLTQSTWTKPDV